tara:strand:- start:198 stop:365 length:168 start_codon:yes stop_codon:yes gene_type:complete
VGDPDQGITTNTPFRDTLPLFFRETLFCENKKFVFFFGGEGGNYSIFIFTNFLFS